LPALKSLTNEFLPVPDIALGPNRTMALVEIKATEERIDKPYKMNHAVPAWK
jgi:hypothetical protein